jgi:hypothetical protein
MFPSMFPANLTAPRLSQHKACVTASSASVAPRAQATASTSRIAPLSNWRVCGSLRITPKEARVTAPTSDQGPTRRSFCQRALTISADILAATPPALERLLQPEDALAGAPVCAPPLSFIRLQLICWAKPGVELPGVSSESSESVRSATLSRMRAVTGFSADERI